MKTYSIKIEHNGQRRIATFRANEAQTTDAILVGEYQSRNRQCLGDAYNQFDLWACTMLTSPNYKAVRTNEGHVFMQGRGGYFTTK